MFFVLQIIFIISLHEFYTLFSTINNLHTKKEKNRLLMFKRCKRGENGVPVENPLPLRHLDTLRLRRHCYSLNLLFSCYFIAFFFVFVSSLFEKNWSRVYELFCKLRIVKSRIGSLILFFFKEYNLLLMAFCLSKLHCVN